MPPIEGLADYGAGFKTVGEAVHLRNHVLGQLAAAASADDPAVRAAALTFVVVGGGFAGVEALAELQGLADEAVRFHPALAEAELHWVLVEATGRILPELDERLARWVLRAAHRSRRLAGPPRLPPVLGADPQPQGTSARRLDARPVLPPRDRPARLPGAPRRRLP
jgi:hypothetical protein